MEESIISLACMYNFLFLSPWQAQRGNEDTSVVQPIAVINLYHPVSVKPLYSSHLSLLRFLSVYLSNAAS